MQKEMVKAISELIDKVKPYLKKSGLTMPNIVFNAKNFDRVEPKAVEEAKEWLEVFLEAYCKEIDKAIALVPAGVWMVYENCGIKGSYEQEQLKLAKQLVRKMWINRPSVLHKKLVPLTWESKTKKRKQSSR